MKRNDAINTLARAGLGKEAREVIDRWSAKADRSFGEIRKDTTRTDEYKRWAMAVKCHQICKSLNAELENMAGRIVSTDRDDAEWVFGVRGVSGDPASLVISRRDAGDRVAGITEGKELRELLARATRSGDEVLARAVAERALEMGNAETLNKFIEDRPQLEASVERLWKAERAETGSASFAVSVGLMGLKPEELGGMSFDAIDGLALQGEPGTALSGSSSGWG